MQSRRQAHRDHVRIVIEHRDHLVFPLYVQVHQAHVLAAVLFDNLLISEGLEVGQSIAGGLGDQDRPFEARSEVVEDAHQGLGIGG